MQTPRQFGKSAGDSVNKIYWRTKWKNLTGLKSNPNGNTTQKKKHKGNQRWVSRWTARLTETGGGRQDDVGLTEK